MLEPPTLAEVIRRLDEQAETLGRVDSAVHRIELHEVADLARFDALESRVQALEEGKRYTLRLFAGAVVTSLAAFGLSLLVELTR